MTYKEALAAIKAGTVQSLYLIGGEETNLADKVEKALLNRLFPGQDRDGLTVLAGDTGWEELAYSVEATPFFSDKNVVVVRNTNLFKEKKKSNVDNAETASKGEERLLALFENMPPYSILIFKTSDKLDKRRRLYKSIAKHGCVVEVNPIRSWEIKDWLTEKLKESGRQFDREAFEHFVAAMGIMQTVSLGFLENEVDKVLLYSDKKIIGKSELVAVLANVPEISVFSMLEAVSDRDTAKALHLLTEQLSGGDHPLKVVTMLARQVRQLWQAKLLAQQGLSGKKIAEQLGMVTFIAEKLVQKSQRFKEDTLQQAIVALAEADYKLKSGQTDATALEWIVIGLCKG